MSDVVIVSKSTFNHTYVDAGHVPYGSILEDDEDTVVSDFQTIEGMFDGAVPATDWRGIDVATPAVESVKSVDPVKRGRPRKVKVD